jgi:hypothetical protein
MKQWDSPSIALGAAWARAASTALKHVGKAGVHSHYGADRSGVFGGRAGLGAEPGEYEPDLDLADATRPESPDLP